ncbi:hypothetical protein C6P46_001466 [Rhodotorula mucilaginosa]|uniref:F-box domain-containing protein n=1 Tax=Rhodotorula mucilaginosa TaxID=5537 RepID=A0A9P7B8D0_RHOMI|nr:hypothetical protein C6P46_001466 [Rhodotorula mucilaginosa]
MPRKAATQARTRLAAGADASYGVDSEDEQGFDASESETEEHARPVVKKKKTRRSSVRTTRKGTLSGLLRLPAELITGICEHLDLGTLFHVSRLNKYLWRLLRQTSSLEYLWERARIESGLPELTAAGMNVFEYANLVFGCCQGCGVSTAKVDYLLRVRYCSPCAKTAIWNDKDGPYEGLAWYNLLAPVSDMTSNGRIATSFKFLVSEVEHTRRHLQDMDDGGPVTNKHENDCQHVVCATLGERYTKHELREAWSLHAEQRTQDGGKLMKWQLARGEEHKKELEKIRQRRREAYARPLELHRQASDARFLDVARTRRRFDIKCEYVRLSRDEARQLGITPKPRWVDFQKLPTIQAIIGVTDVQNVYDEPNPTIRDHIDGIVKDLPLAVDKLGAELRDLLRKVIQGLQPRAPALRGILGSDTDTTTQQTSPDTSTDGLLDLAIALFECKFTYCGYVDTFPRILSHACSVGEHLPSQYAYVPSEKAILNLLTLLKVKSMPCDTKSAELDKLGPTWTCLDHPLARVACTWTELLQHMAPHCSAQNVVQESLEAAKDRVFAVHLANSNH